MNSDALIHICVLVGGPGRLAEMIGVNCSTVWRKMNGKTGITKGDELKVRQAVSDLIDGLQKSLTR